METTSRDLVPIDPAGRPGGAALPVPILQEVTSDSEFLCTFPIVDGKDDAVILNAMSDADHSCKQMVGKTLQVVGGLVYRGKRTDEETGEIADTLVTVLILENGETVASTSAYVRKFIGRLLLHYGQKKWAPPIPVELSLKDLGNSHTCIKAKIVGEYVPAVQGGDKQPGSKKRAA